MNRRQFLQVSGILMGLQTACRSLSAKEAASQGQVMTVLGPIAPDELGVTLPHEHVLVDFIGADQVSPDRYDPDEVFEVVLPHLQRVKELGCQALAECTPAYLGRDVAVLKRLAAASGLHLLTCTGYYGAADDKFVPAHAYTETADQLAARWTQEWEEGIEGTGIRPGFIKIGVDAGPLSEIDRKLVQAAARTHLATGLTIEAHTGDGTAAQQELAVLSEEGVDWSAFIWVHAQNERRTSEHARLAEGGAWVEFDSLGPQSVQQYVNLVTAMKNNGRLDRVLLSHDAGWYSVGEPRGGSFRLFDTLFTQLLPALRQAGFTDAEIRQLTVDNPREAFPVRVRKPVTRVDLPLQR